MTKYQGTNAAKTQGILISEADSQSAPKLRDLSRRRRFSVVTRVNAYYLFLVVVRYSPLRELLSDRRQFQHIRQFSIATRARATKSG